MHDDNDPILRPTTTKATLHVVLLTYFAIQSPMTREDWTKATIVPVFVPVFVPIILVEHVR